MNKDQRCAVLWFKMCNSRSPETVVSHEHSTLWGVETSAAKLVHLNSHQLLRVYLFLTIIICLSTVYISDFNFQLLMIYWPNLFLRDDVLCNIPWDIHVQKSRMYWSFSYAGSGGGGGVPGTVALGVGSLLFALRLQRRWHIYPTKVHRGGSRNSCRKGKEVRERWAEGTGRNWEPRAF